MSQTVIRPILIVALLGLFTATAVPGQIPDPGSGSAPESRIAPEFHSIERDALQGSGTSDAVIHLEQSLATFQSTITTESGNGNQLVDIEVLTSTGPITYFSGVFYPVGGTVHTLIHQDETTWDAFIANMTLLDGRWLDVEVGYHGGATRKYSAIFLEDGNNHNFLLDADMSEATLQATLEAQLRAGFALVDFEAHTNPTSGETRFDAIWTKDERQPMTHLYYDLESADVTDLLNPLAGRVIDLERYHSSFFGEERFALVMANYPGGNWSFDREMTQPELGTLNASNSDSDTHLIDLDVFLDSSSNVRYGGVWGDNWKSLNEVAEIPADSNPVALTTGLNNLINTFEVTKPNNVEGIVGFHARNLRTNQSVSYRADEPFYLASAAKTAAHIRFWMQVEAGHFAPLDESTTLAYSNNADTGAPWYVDERDFPGFASGSPGRNDDLGEFFSLNRFDRGMMTESDNAATSALIDDTGIGLAHDATNLNEWLSGVDGVGKGWGFVTSIHDVDRLIFWNGQHTDALKNDPSYFLAPGHTFGPRRRSTAVRACTILNVAPTLCVPSSSCNRCNVDADCQPGGQGSETCEQIEDPWGDLRNFFGLSGSDPIPDFDRIGYSRAFASGTNSATPRAYANLLEKFWDGEFLSTTQPLALDNMGEGTRVDDNLCRFPGCGPDEDYKVWSKGGSKGSIMNSSIACTSTAIIQMADPGNSGAEDEVFVLTWFTRDNGAGCGNPGIGSLYTADFAEEILQAIAVDLAFDNGSFTPPTLVQDGELRVDVSLDNLGGAFTNTQFVVELWASENMILDPDGGLDVKIADLPFNGISSFGGAGVGNYPVQQTLPPGTYNIFYIIDPPAPPVGMNPQEYTGQIPELDESDASNRGLLTGQQLTILPPCPDDDGDGYADCDPGCLPGALLCDDCDDTVDTTYPGAIEQCNGIDDDCDTVIDNDIPTPTYARRVQHEDPQHQDYFGSDVANVGDVDGDGLDDLAIGMRSEDLPAGINLGLVRVVSSADFSTICEATLPVPTSRDNLGWSVAAAGGDLNANATDDFVVGIPYYDNPPHSNSGAVAAFNLPDCAFIRLMIDPVMDSSDELGSSVTSIGDVNNDNVPDIAAGSTRSSLSVGFTGGLSVFSGADGGKLYNAFDPAGVAEKLGWSLAGPGDLTGDGVPDIVSGAPETNTVLGGERGAVYVFSGVDGSLHAMWDDAGGTAFADFGNSVAAIGDITADGVSEIAVGSPGDIVGGFRIGSVPILDGATGVILRRLIDPNATSGSGFGNAVAAIEDLSGDGLPDVIVGADLADNVGTDTGAVFLFDSSNAAVLHHLFDTAPRNGDELGSRVVSLGDLSGDGVSEFAAGAMQADDLEGAQAGHVIVFSIEEDCDADGISPYQGDCDDSVTAISPDATEVCDGIDNNCDGTNNEDVDGDGFGVCSDCNDQDPRVNPDAVEICNGIDDDCVGGIDFTPGMVDGDGDGVDPPCDCDDTNPLIEPGNTEICDHIDNDCNGIPDDGASMLVSERISELADGVFQDTLGTSIASLGDVNFDGIDDYAAGAPGSDLAGNGSGAAVVFDGATGLPHCTATPTTEIAAVAGSTVAGIGDVNGDGAGDLAIGAPSHDAAATNAGKVFVVSGADCTTIRELSDSNGAAYDQLGLSVAGIGDLTGDGIGEIAAGAPWVDTAQDQTAGAVMVWNGATGAELFKLMDSRSGGSRVGTSVSGIGDVNADGIPDILAGAPFEDGLLGSDVGSVLVFSGADGSVIRKILDPAGFGGDDLGTSVAGIGDLNGDGIPEILAGAPDEDTGGSNNGAVLVFSGADGDLILRVPLADTFGNRRFGTSVTALPDLNGDGVPEFAGGAPDDDDVITDGGRVLVISGATLTVLHDITVADSSEGSKLGASLAAVGDLSGDGYPEILIGQPGQNTGEDNDAGRIVVIGFESDCDADGVGLLEDDCDDQNALRAPGMLEICDGVDNDCDTAIDEDEDGDGADACADCAPAVPTILPGMFEVCNAIDDDCNMQVDEGVDLDGDGYTTPCDCNDDDFDVNAGIGEICNAIDDNCDGQVDEGFGSPLDQVRIEDPQAAANHALGTSMAVVGDVNNDGFVDLVAGVPGDGTGANGAGAALLLSGASRTVICRMIDPAAASGVQMGDAVAGVGDVTADGIPDVAIGSRRDDPFGALSGSVQIFSGADCSWVRELLDPSGATQDQFGASVAGIGDVNGDGIGDIGVGVPRDDENGLNDTGSVVVFDGASGAWLYTAVDLHARASDWMGTSVSALGDVDFDGIPDFAAGALVDQVDGSANAGSVSVFSGVDGQWIKSFTHPSAAQSDEMARSIAAAGDMNGDGVPDLLAGIENDDSPSNSGSVLAFSGADGSVIRTFQDSAPLSNANLGYSVAAAGDLNGDGITEVVAGAHDSSRSGTGAGEVVVFDGASGVVLHRFVDLNPASDDDLGASVLVAGDLTGGGTVEILAGAPKADPGGQSSAGYIAVFSLEPDCDGDGLSPLFDCDDADSDTQGGPGAIQSLVFDSKSMMSWMPPGNPGGSPTTLSYDVVRSDDAADFTTATLCVESDDDTDTAATDSDEPAPGNIYAYLVRVQNRCGNAVEEATQGSRSVAECP